VKAKNYREVKGQAYTRREYAKSRPPSKIVKFTMGDTKTKFPIEARLVSKENAQIRHNALEAARIATNRLLSLELGENYFLRIMPFPHTILRENKMIFGAHADRLQDGMRRAFGKPIGVAARVKIQQTIITIGVTKDSVEIAKQALKRGKAKLPMTCRIVINQPGD
jgi:large subunit ribosomal protein L10e